MSTVHTAHRPAVIKIARAEGEDHDLILARSRIFGGTPEAIARCLRHFPPAAGAPRRVRLEAVHRAAPVLHDTELDGDRCWLAIDPDRRISALYRPERGQTS